MIIFAKIRLSIDYKVFILLNVHPAPAKDVLIYENGRYKAVFWIITDENGYPSSLINSMSVLFKRPDK
jgi:hypothetical protein